MELISGTRKLHCFLHVTIRRLVGRQPTICLEARRHSRENAAVDIRCDDLHFFGEWVGLALFPPHPGAIEELQQSLFIEEMMFISPEVVRGRRRLPQSATGR